MTGRLSLLPLLAYFAIAFGDAGYHLSKPPIFGGPLLSPERVIVAMDAGLFWPVDLVAARLSR